MLKRNLALTVIALGTIVWAGDGRSESCPAPSSPTPRTVACAPESTEHRETTLTIVALLLAGGLIGASRKSRPSSVRVALP